MEGKLTHLQSATSDAGCDQPAQAAKPRYQSCGAGCRLCGARLLTHRDVIRADELDFILLFAVRRPAICSGGACLLPTQHGCCL